MNARFAMSSVSAIVLATSLMGTARADISPYPDDYDVAKYTAIFNQAAQQHANAEAVLGGMNQRLAEAAAGVQHEQGELDRLRAAARQADQTADAAEDNAHHLRDQIEQAKTQLANLQPQLDAAQAALNESQGRRQGVADQAQRADQAAAAADRDVADKANTARPLDDAVSQKQAAASQLQGQANGAARNLQDAQSRRAAAQSAVSNANARLSQLTQQLASAQSNLSSATNAASQATSAAQQAHAAADRADQDARDADAHHAPDAERKEHLARQLREQAEQADRAARQAQAQVPAAQASVSNLTNAVASARNDVASAQQQLSSADAQIAPLTQQLQQLQNAVAGAQREVQQAQAAAASADIAVAQARSAASQAHQAANQAHADLNDVDRQVADAQNRITQLHQTRDNLNASMPQWATQADQLQQQADANHQRMREFLAHAEEEQQELAHAQYRYNDVLGDRDRAAAYEHNADLQMDAARARLAQVQANLNNGIQVATNDGNYDGSTDGATEGARQAQINGPRDGADVGQREGRDKGLLEGYQAGKAEGYSTAYPDGQVAGHAAGGLDKGRAEGFAQGKSRGQAEGSDRGAADGTAKGQSEFLNANLANATLPNHGLQSAAYDHNPQWQNYNPRRSYPVQPLNAAYASSYQNAFYSSAASTYDRVYAQAYSQAHDVAYENARQAALPERHDQGVRDGRDEGYARGKDDAYNADYAQGQADGDKAGYSASYQPSYDGAASKAYNDVVAYYANNDSLKFDGAVAVDANEDGVFAPGETVSLTLAIKNFGKVSQRSDVKVALSSPSRNIVLDSPSDSLAKLPGQSRTVVTGVTSFRIAPTAPAGSSESVTVTITEGTKVLAETQLAMTVGYPYAVASIEHTDYPAAGQDNAVTVQVRNGSSKLSAGDVTVRLVSTDGLAQPTTAAAALGRLAAGEQKDAQLGFTFAATSANRILSFEVQVYEGSWLLGRRQFKVDSTKRWQYTPSSTALVVLSTGDDGARADAAAKLAGLGFDAYDTRVEGALTSDVALKYLDKAVVLPTLGTGLGDGTAVAVKTLLDNGGRVFVGLSDSTRNSPVGSVVTAFEQRTSMRSFGDLSVYAGNGFQSGDTHAVLVEGTEFRAERTEQSAADLISFDLVRGSFNDQITAYVSAMSGANDARIQNTREAVLYSLGKEMADNKAIKGDNYKKHKDALKLTAFINLALGKQGAERRSMLLLYPELEKLRTQYEQDGWFRSTPIKDVLKPLKQAHDKEIGK